MDLGPVRRELDRLGEAGRTLDLWWRDDDAVAATPALDRLLVVSARFALPVALAIIPAGVTGGLARRLEREPGIAVLVHGHAHANHAPPGIKRSEYPEGRDPGAMRVEMASGLACLRELFGARALPVFVPPWNRITPRAAALLAGCGYRGASVFGRSDHTGGFDGVIVHNTHLDPVDWRNGGTPTPPTILASRLADAAAGGEPVGLLTHHLIDDPAIWRLLEALVELLALHPCVRRRSAVELWPPPGH